MTRVATCPKCAAQLAVPDSATRESQANCPYCNAEFALAGAIRELRNLSVSNSQGAKESELKNPFASEATLPDMGGDMPTLSTLFERFRDIPRADEDDEIDIDESTSELADTVVSGSSNMPRDPFDFDTGELGIERPANIEYQPNALEQSEPVIAASEPKPEERAFVAEVVSVSQKHKRRSRGNGSMVRQMVGVVGGGVIGLTLGYFALLWWRGPDGDLLGIADRIPSMLLPSSFDAIEMDEDRTALAEADDATKSEVEPVTFVSPTAPTEKPKAAPEPKPFEPPPAQPLVATVKDAPSYSPAQLTAALAPAEAARTGLLTGSLADAATKRTKGESYVKLCQIAETLTFLDDFASTENSRKSAATFFADILSDVAARNEIGQIAMRWIEFPKRPHGGVFLAGSIVSAKQAGSAHELQLELASGETVTIITATPPAAQTGLVGVVGSVIEYPAVRIAGYTGTASQAIWSRLVFPVE